PVRRPANEVMDRLDDEGFLDPSYVAQERVGGPRLTLQVRAALHGRVRVGVHWAACQALHGQGGEQGAATGSGAGFRARHQVGKAGAGEAPAARQMPCLRALFHYAATFALASASAAATALGTLAAPPKCLMASARRRAYPVSSVTASADAIQSE